MPAATCPMMENLGNPTVLPARHTWICKDTIYQRYVDYHKKVLKTWAAILTVLRFPHTSSPDRRPTFLYRRDVWRVGR